MILPALFLALVALAATAPVAASSASIRVDVSDQKLELREAGRVVKIYRVSTSRYGIGNRQLSNKTPLGKHVIAKKIGDDAPSGTVFKNRARLKRKVEVNRSKTEPTKEDLVTTRILWLRGLEPGVNSGKRVDTFHRLIYIHGTPDEGFIGKPASHGCVRMKNAEVIDLYRRVEEGTPVEIVE